MPLPIPLLAPVTTTDFPAIDVSMRRLPRTFWLQQCSNPNTRVRVLVEIGIESEEERVIETIESHIG
jgi:hypothetical protein